MMGMMAFSAGSVEVSGLSIAPTSVYDGTTPHPAWTGSPSFTLDSEPITLSSLDITTLYENVGGTAYSNASPPINAGNYTVTVTFEGDCSETFESYTAEWTASFEVEKADQPADVAIIGGNIAKVFGDSPFTISATGGAGAGVFAYTSSNTAVATVNATSGEVTIVGVGTTTLSAIRAADTNYNASNPGTVDLTVTLANQPTVSISGIPGTVTVNDTTITLTLTGGAGIGNWVVTSNDTNVATVGVINQGAGTVDITIGSTEGPVTITAYKAGDDNYEQSNSATETFSVGPAPAVGITAYPTTLSFVSITYEDQQPAARTVLITNIGTSATGTLTVGLTGEDASKFTVTPGNGQTFDLEPNGTGTYTQQISVRPDDNLDAGTYSFTINVAGAGISTNIPVSFTVNKKAITSVAVTGVTPPVIGAAPSTAVTSSAGYTAALTWSPNHNLFQAGTTYIAQVLLTLEDPVNYTFNGLSSATINTEAAVPPGGPIGDTNPITITRSFTTGARTPTDLAIKTQPTTLAYRHGEALDLSGLEVTITYNDATTEDVSFSSFAGRLTTSLTNGTVLNLTTHNNQPITVTLTSGGLTATTGNLTVTKAEAPVAASRNIDIVRTANSYSLDLTSLLPLAANRGTTTFSAGTVTGTGSSYVTGVTGTATGVTINMTGNATLATTAVFTVTVTMQYIEDMTITVTVTFTDLAPMVVTPAVTGTVSYGQPLSTLGITATVTVGGTNRPNAGTIAWVNPTDVLDAGSHTPSWIFTPIQTLISEGYTTVTDTPPVTITVNKAVPRPVANNPTVAFDASVDPTLAGALLTGSFVNPNNSTLTVPGALTWQISDLTTVVVRGSNYRWNFVPDAPYNDNYYSIENTSGGTNSIVIWPAPPPPPPTTFTVTFSLNGGTRTGGGELSQTVRSGNSATAPTVTRSGYTFDGWSGSFTNVTSNRTITAQWRQVVAPPATPRETPPPTPREPDPDHEPVREPLYAHDVSDRTVEIALISDIPVVIMLDQGSSTVISEDALQAIKESGSVLQIALPNGIVVSIDSASITDGAVATDLNITLEVAQPGLKVGAVEFPDNSYIIMPSTHGDFGFELSFDISAEKLAEAGLMNVNVRLFHVSEFDEVTDYGPLAKNDDGSVTITISHASRWILADDTPIMEIPPVIDDFPVEDPIIDPAPPIDVAPPALPDMPRSSLFDSTLMMGLMIGGAVAIALGGVAFILLRRRHS
jgi:hypothetical protein